MLSSILLPIVRLSLRPNHYARWTVALQAARLEAATDRRHRPQHSRTLRIKVRGEMLTDLV